ncbi:MAG: anthranilate synthase component I family protein, partial [bacterium]
PFDKYPSDLVSSGVEKVTSNTEAGEFEEMVEKAKEYIRSGDIFQTVLSQRFSLPLTGDPFDVYRAVRIINPSPYMFYLKLGDLKLIGASPEVLVRLEDREIEVHPIAGTKPRGKTHEEDLRNEKELINSPKELAEHTMLLDLGRNDVGRVAVPGTVAVSESMVVRRYSHVMHLESNVKGKLKEGCHPFDVLRACFPAGTVSGAPKIRAMEIIDELEKVRRGPYAGAVGYFGYNGNFDTCIAIRTIIVKGDRAYVQAGAGIVADSVPKEEYRESVNKAMALIKAVELAAKG